MSSSPSNSNPATTTTTTTTSSESDADPSPPAAPVVDAIPKSNDASALPEAEVVDSAATEVEEDEEEMECGFCLFMKGGGCKDPFIAWEKCVEEAEKTGEDVVEKCFEVTSILKKCMDAHADYYAPVLAAEEAASAAEAEAVSKPETRAEVIVVGNEPRNQS